jgi:hypothetical protein
MGLAVIVYAVAVLALRQLMATATALERGEEEIDPAPDLEPRTAPLPA